MADRQVINLISWRVRGPKIYMDDLITVSVDSITTDHMQALCVGLEERRNIEVALFYLADGRVISTGESLTALDKLVNAVGRKYSRSDGGRAEDVQLTGAISSSREVTSVR